MGVRLGSVSPSCGGELVAQLRQFIVQRRFITEQRGELFVALMQLRFKFLQLIERLRHGGYGERNWQQLQQKAQTGIRPRLQAVGASQPIAKVKQLTGCRHRISGQHFARTVNGQIAQVFNQFRFGEQRIPQHRPKARLVNLRGEIILVRQAERFVMLVQPRYRKLQRAPGVKARGTRVSIRHALCFVGRLKEERPFRVQESEI